MKRFALLFASPLSVFAHEGHGMPAGHWHASDTMGLVLVTVLAAFAIWTSRR